MERLELLKFLLLFFVALMAYIQFWSANAFKRAQYMSELWRNFYTNQKFVEIFEALETKDKDKFNVKNKDSISKQDIFLFLGYLEEIAIFCKRKPYQIYKLEEKDLLNLFQFHFYYIYQEEDTRNMFWGTFLNQNEIENEIHSFYWKKQYRFSLKCKQRIERIS
jgi:hypothetical protein